MGATAGFLVGMIPGFGLKSIGKGLIGAATGAGVGMLGASAGKAIGVPGLADGGIVNTPTLALIGEKGPEAVIPLAGGAGANTLTEAQNKTNQLLMAILGSSEKQVNRLGDIGTS
jgi:SLT domain-containing protein